MAKRITDAGAYGVKIGDKVTHYISAFAQNGRNCKSYTGTVIYIHPKGRFYRAEFKLPYGTFREAFLIGR